VLRPERGELGFDPLDLRSVRRERHRLVGLPPGLGEDQPREQLEPPIPHLDRQAARTIADGDRSGEVPVGHRDLRQQQQRFRREVRRSRELCRALREAPRGPDVLPVVRAIGGPHQVRRRSRPRVGGLLVGRAELGPVSARLLEVVSEDLVVLGDALPRHALEPLREPLVQVRALFLRHRLVRGVADQQVSEPECVLPRELGSIRTDQLLPREREQA
jgi:hypothetical protein